MFFPACIGTRVHVDGEDGRAVVAVCAKLESEFDEIARRIERVEATAGDLDSEIDRLNAVLREYIDGVRRLRATVSDLQREAARQEE